MHAVLGIRLVALAGTLAATLASPAQAATTGDTTTTFTVQAGALSIAVPASAAVGSGTPGSSFSGQLGAVTVTDTRALLTASWTATVSSTDFTTGGGTAAETIAKANVSYWSGLATSTSGVGVFTPGQATAVQAQSLSVPRTAFTLTAGTGNNTAAWNPTLVVSVPAAAVGGTYTGTVTHSVA